MGKIRVYELAKELGLENQECVKRLVAAGFSVKSHSSTVDEEDARRALSRPAEKKPEVVKKVTTVIRRRTAESMEAAPGELGQTPEPAAPEVRAPAAVPEQEPVAAPVAVAAEPETVAAAPVETPVQAAPVTEAAPAAAAPVGEAAAAAPAPTVRAPKPAPVQDDRFRAAAAHAPSSPQAVSAAAAAAAARAPAPRPNVPGTQATTGTSGSAPWTRSPTQPTTGRPVHTQERTMRPAGSPTFIRNNDRGPDGRPLAGRPGVVARPGGPAAPAVPGAPAATPGTPEAAAEQVSHVTRRIDPAAIAERLRADKRTFAPRGPRGPNVSRDVMVRPGPGGPTMVDVNRGPFTPGAPGAAPGGGARPGKRKAGSGRSGTEEAGAGEKRGVDRADARDLWVTFDKKKKPSKRGQETQVTTPAAHKRVIEMQGTIQVGELARQMSMKVGDIIRKLMSMGVMATMNQTIDFDTATIIAGEFQFEVKNVAFQETDILEGQEQVEAGEIQSPRPPVVTIMGHVDHGKTSLLDAIRAEDVAAGEHGGITQHIGAYWVKTPKGVITFLDTPGHEAFTAMRARGSKITDIVVLVVAADDGVMPQTQEAVNHAKLAKVPVIVAVNKMDKPGANPERVMQQLAEHDLLPEQWGGKTIYVPVSAKRKDGIPELLEAILLQSEVMELKAAANKRGKGTVVEAQLDKGRGPVATVLVQEGTLKLGDNVVAGDFFGRVRAMYDDRGTSVKEATPSIPVAVLGLSGVPQAGDRFDVVAGGDMAKTVAEHRARVRREKELAIDNRVTLDRVKDLIAQKDLKQLNLVVKGDVQGSVEALSAALTRLTNHQVKVVIVNKAVGGVTESDVNTAIAGDAIIIGFGVRADPKAAAHAEQHNVDIRHYNIIYEAVAEVRDAMEGLLAPTYREKYLGKAEVRQVFQVSKVGAVAGCSVMDGKITRSSKVRLMRENKQLFDGKILSLRRFKDDVREVTTGFECGIGIEGFNDLQAGDVIEAYEMEVIRSKLEGVPEGGGPQKPQEARAQ